MRRHFIVTGTAAAAAALVVPLVLASGAPVALSSSTEGIPHLDHVFVIVLENEGAASTWQTPGSYLNGLLSQGAFAEQYYGSSHVSADNYIAMTSGQMPTPLFQSDCIDWSKCETWEASRPDGGVSVAQQLDAAGETWKAYMDGMSSPCLHPAGDSPTSPVSADPNQVGYATRHDPFVYYPPVVGDQAYCDSHVVPFTDFATDIASPAKTPDYAFITPDTCHDGHDSPCTGPDANEPGAADGGLVSANDWMSTEVPAILSSPAFTTPGVASVLFITTDEAAVTDPTGCTTGSLQSLTVGTCASGVPALGLDGGGLVGLLAIGSPSANVAAGTTTSAPYDHASLLRTVEDGLGLGPLGGTGVLEDSAGHLNQAGSPLEHSMATLFSVPA